MVYIGGKQKLSKFICPILQKELDAGNYEAYVEPFVGGANIISNINYKLKIGYDLNKELIAFWKALQNGWKMPDPNSYNGEHFNEVRKLYRENSDKYPDYYYGYMSIVPVYNGRPWDSYCKSNDRHNYVEEHTNNIIKQLPFIKDIIFENENYKNLKLENCLIYCDPPYADSRKNYYNKGFNTNEFWEWCRLISKNNKVFVSETQAPEDFIKVWEKEYKRTTCSQKKGMKTTEKLFTI